MHRRRRALAGLLVAALGLGVASADAIAVAKPTAGSPGVGDPYYPSAGNGGYQVSHYDIDVSVTGHRISGTTVVTARSTRALGSFHLDLALPASAVTVNGEAATFRQRGSELVVEPAAVWARGSLARIEVSYAGRPDEVRDRSIADAWFTRGDDVLVLGEPRSAPLWFPSNDHPSDEASYDIAISVPRGKQALSVGRLVSRRSEAATTTWRWSLPEETATYLTFLAVGDYRIEQGRTAGLPYLYAFSRDLSPAVMRSALRSIRASGRVTAFLARTFGTYPFKQLGGVVVKHDVGFALETQTRPVYSHGFFRGGPNTSVVAHELAHQWFGDRISVRSWKHIWLNEGLATYAEQLWSARHGGWSPARTFKAYYERADRGFWRVRIGDPGRVRMFDSAVYYRGAMTIQALRNRVGAAEVARILRSWVGRNDGAGATTGQFIRHAEKVSGANLDRFFRAWLFSTKKPPRATWSGVVRG